MDWLWYALAGVGAAVVAFLAIVVIRALRFQPYAEPSRDNDTVEVDRRRAVDTLAELVRFRTVSRRDPAREEDAEFQGFSDALARLFPNVTAACSRRDFAGRAILYRWQGRGEGEPAVLMAHYDVVPAAAEAWEKPPFEGILEGDVLWGRGTLDTKVTVASILLAAEELIGRGFVPAADVYFAFSGGEEVNGEGAKNIVAYFKEQGITPAIVLDEGGAVVENVFPGVRRPSAMIGIAEKGLVDVRYRTTTAGGHASAPLPHTPVGELSAVCRRIEDHPFPYHVCEPARKMFDTLARHSNFVYRMIFANLWCFGGLLDGLCRRQGGELNALLRTTVAFTQMQGSDASNVIPTEATMVSNIRLNPEDSIAGALSRLKKLAANDRVEITAITGSEPSRVSTTECEGWEKLSLAVASTWRDAVITPYLMVQCSDSRHWGEISDRVYRFSAMDLTREERATIHGNNERIRVDCLARAVEFYLRLMQSL